MIIGIVCLIAFVAWFVLKNIFKKQNHKWCEEFEEDSHIGRDANGSFPGMKGRNDNYGYQKAWWR